MQYWTPYVRRSVAPSRLLPCGAIESCAARPSGRRLLLLLTSAAASFTWVGWFSAELRFWQVHLAEFPLFATAVGAMRSVEVLRRQIRGKHSCQAHRARAEKGAMPLGWVATGSPRHWRRGFMHVGERASNPRAGMCRESVPVASCNFFSCLSFVRGLGHGGTADRSPESEGSHRAATRPLCGESRTLYCD